VPAPACLPAPARKCRNKHAEQPVATENGRLTRPIGSSTFRLARLNLLSVLKEKLIKIGAKVVHHGRYVAFQMAEVALPKALFQEILRLIAELRPQPPPAPA